MRCRAAGALVAALASGCSLLVDPPHYEVCDSPHPPQCDGDQLVVCRGDLDVRTTCDAGCDPVTAACVVPSCGNGVTDDGEVCDDENRDSGDGCRADCAKQETCGDGTVDFGEACDDGNLEDGDGCDCHAPDVLVNTTREGKQECPWVATLPGGSALIVWQDESGTAPDTSGLAVRARLLRGTALVGSDLVVNAQTAFDQTDPRVTASAAGGLYLVVWTDASGAAPDDLGTAVRGRLLDDSGSPRGSDFVIPSTLAGDQVHPFPAARPDASFAVVWEDHSGASGDLTGAAIRLRLLDAEGGPDGPDKVVNTTTLLEQTEPAIAVNGTGVALIVWEDGSQTGADTSERAIRGRRVAPDGSFADADDFIINTTTAHDQLQPGVSVLDDDDFLVVWADGSRAPGDPGEIRGRRIPAAGAPAGDDVLLNTTSAGGQQQPSSAALAGAVAVVWEDEGGTAPDVSESAVRVRWIGADGAVAGAPSDGLVNSILFDDQGEPGVAALAGGSVIVVWEDESQTPPDDQEDAVRMKILAPP
jgi:cysteine-rich repeat protein